MPSIMIHLYTGYQFIKTCNLVKNKAQFYLGIVAPDAPNVEGFAEKSIRWSAHLHHSDLEKWSQQVIDFYIENKDKSDNDFLLGYVLHLFSDIAWDKKYNAKMIADINNLPLTEKQKLDARWDEFFYYDRIQCTEPFWVETVRPLLETAKPIELNNIPLDKLEQFKQQTIKGCLESVADIFPSVLTRELIEEYSFYAVAVLKNEL